MEYLHVYRMEQAKLLLMKTEQPVARIAEEVGFRYAPYFSSCFKERTVVAPLTYHKRFAGKG